MRLPGNAFLAGAVFALCLFLSGCATGYRVSALDELPKLAARLGELGPGVDPVEAERVASAALFATQQLADEYRVGSSPHFHNVLVNLGVKQRGLCWHYAEDLKATLLMLDVHTLEFHMAVSNQGSVFKEHNVVVVTAAGQPFETGILLDPWRRPRTLHWAPVTQDHPHHWHLDLR